MATYYLLWDCDKCDNKNIKANLNCCTNCGNQKTSQTPVRKSKIPVKKKLEKLIFCRHCDGQSYISDDFCSNCGEELKSGADYIIKKKVITNIYGDFKHDTITYDTVKYSEDKSDEQVSVKGIQNDSYYEPPIKPVKAVDRNEYDKIVKKLTNPTEQSSTEQDSIGKYVEGEYGEEPIPFYKKPIGEIIEPIINSKAPIITLVSTVILLLLGFVPVNKQVTIIDRDITSFVETESYNEVSDNSWSGFPAGSYNHRVNYNELYCYDCIYTHSTYHTETVCNSVSYVCGQTCTTHDTDNGDGTYSSYESCTDDICYRDECHDEQVETKHYVDEYRNRYYFDIMRWQNYNKHSSHCNDCSEVKYDIPEYVSQQDKRVSKKYSVFKVYYRFNKKKVGSKVDFGEYKQLEIGKTTTMRRAWFYKISYGVK